MSPRAIAITAFLVGLPPLIVAPFTFAFGAVYLLEAIGVHQDSSGVPFDLGFGGILYWIGFPIWIGYLWAADADRSPESLKIFWLISLGLNGIWWVFFLGTTLRLNHQPLSTPSIVWAVYAVFPAILLFLSYFGYLSVSRSHPRR